MSTPGGYLKNVNISTGTINSGENNARKRKEKKRQRATETEWERRSQLVLPKLAGFIYFLAAVVS